MQLEKHERSEQKKWLQVISNEEDEERKERREKYKFDWVAEDSITLSLLLTPKLLNSKLFAQKVI